MEPTHKDLRVSSDREIRVFFSYSHDDADLVRRLATFMHDEYGIVPVYDQSFRAGTLFDEQIGLSIARAHVFVRMAGQAEARAAPR